MRILNVSTFVRKNWMQKLTARSGLLFALLLVVVMSAGCVISPPGDETGPGGITIIGAEPVIAVAPVEGAPGTMLSVSGAGWPSDEPIFIDLVATQERPPVRETVAVVTADEDGRFSTTLAYPTEEPWLEQTLVRVVASGSEEDVRASAIFNVTTAQTATPTPAVAGPGTVTPTATSTPVTETPSATPTRTSAPVTVTPQPGAPGTARVTSTALNVRSGPSIAFPVITSVSRGTTLTVLGQNSEGTWLFVRLPSGLEGWVARSYTDFTGSAPVVATPAPPTASPTATPTSIVAPPVPTPTPSAGEWLGEYYPNQNLSGNPALVRTDPSITFNWGLGSPAPSIPVDNFSARWTRTVSLPRGVYRFYARADDGVRVWVDGELIINEWQDQAATTFTADRTLDDGFHSFRVEYYENVQQAEISFWWERVGDFPEWRGEYYDDADLTPPITLLRNDQSIDFDWGFGSPAPSIPDDFFSVRWTRTLFFDSGTYRFRARVDDGVRVFVDDRLVIDRWREGSTAEFTGDIFLESGNHLVRVEYVEYTGEANIRVSWERIRTDDDDDDDEEDFPDWKGEYWDNIDFDDDPEVRRNDESITFNWGTESPDPEIPDDNFSARWTREVDFAPGLYRFYARADDGIRFFVDDVLVLNEWRPSLGLRTYTVDLFLDDDHDLRVEYYEGTGRALAIFWWQMVVETPTPPPVPTDTPTLTPTPTPTGSPTGAPTDTPTLTPTPTATVGEVPFTQVEPAAGPAGTQVTVTGGNFPANTTVNVYLGTLIGVRAAGADAEIYATGTTGDDGEFSVSFEMPAEWEDGRPILAGRLVILAATEGFEEQATTLFDYQPLAPTFTPTPTGTLTPTAVPTATETPTGPTATPTQQARATVQPDSGTANTQVTVSGGGFPANTTVNAYLGVFEGPFDPSELPISYASALTGENGQYTMSFVMPATWPDGTPIESGNVAIIVATEDFEQTASALFNYVSPTPTPVAPDDAAARRSEIRATLEAADGDRPLLEALRERLQGDAEAAPTERPTEAPTARPTSTPMIIPTATPTPVVEAPTATPTVAPTAAATAAPAPRATATSAPVRATPTATSVVEAPAAPAATATPVPPTPVPPTSAPPEEPEEEVAQPSLIVRPDVGSPGSPILVTGRGFPANTPVRIDLRLEGTELTFPGIASDGTNFRGVFRTTFAMPVDWPGGTATLPGDVVITAVTADGGVQASTRFNLSP
jgi:hypothetical protein